MKKLTKTINLIIETPYGTYSEPIKIKVKSLEDLEKQAEELSQDNYKQFIENITYYYEIEEDK